MLREGIMPQPLFPRRDVAGRRGSVFLQLPAQLNSVKIPLEESTCMNSKQPSRIPVTRQAADAHMLCHPHVIIQMTSQLHNITIQKAAYTHTYMNGHKCKLLVNTLFSGLLRL